MIRRVYVLPQVITFYRLQQESLAAGGAGAGAAADLYDDDGGQPKRLRY
jgi:hypothetical protein